MRKRKGQELRGRQDVAMAHRRDLDSESMARGDGCEVHPACLSCPLPQCVFDTPDGLHKWRLEQRNQRIRDVLATGLSKQEIATRFTLDIRTIQRIIHTSEHDVN